MMKTSDCIHWAGAVLALTSVGCGGTVRHLTASHWHALQDGAAPSAAQAEGDTAAEGTAAQGTGRVLYLAYWEGTCRQGALGVGRGCSKGDSKVRRCVAQADNSLVCTDDAAAEKVLSTSN